MLSPPDSSNRASWWGTAALMGVVAGTAVQLQQPRLWAAVAYAACVLMALLYCVFAKIVRRGQRRGLSGVSVMLAAALITFGQIGLRSVTYANSALLSEFEGRDLLIEGTIIAMPQLRDNGVRFRMEVDAAWADQQPVRLPPLVDLSWYARGLFERRDDAARLPAVPHLAVGQRWSMAVRLKTPRGTVNPFGFDYELWAWEQGVQAVGYVRTDKKSLARAPRLLGENGAAYPVERLRQRVRDAILKRLGRDGSGIDVDPSRARAAGVVAALVTGDQRAIDRRDWDIFRITGVAHLVSISGLHITMFAWLASGLIGWLWRRVPALCLRMPAQTAGTIGGMLLATGYATFSGWGVPAQRTIYMLAVVSLLRLSGRRWPWPHVWLLACVLVLLLDPWAMLQAGFWLSFVAVGMLFASDLPSAVDTSQAQEASSRMARWWCVCRLHVKQLWRQQWVVTLALAPLTLLLFGQVSIVGLVANLLAIPWLTLVILPVAFMGIVWPPLWDVAQTATWAFTLFLQWCASLAWAQLTLPVAPIWAAVFAAIGGAWLALGLPWRWRVLALPCLLPALWWMPLRPASGQVELLAIDVGQGQALLVRTAHHSLLYDAGPMYSAESDAGERIVVPLLRAMGERLDMLVLSHRDVDHSGGASSVLAQQPQAVLIGSMEREHSVWKGRHFRPCQAGQSWLWDGVRFEVLHPTPEQVEALADPDRVRPSSNSVSCVLQITDASGVAALLVGDVEQCQERELLARGALQHVSYLLVPHHGSRSSSSAAFLDALRPQVAVVQAGYRNRFGHPAPDVMQRYADRGIPVPRTAACGAVGWRSEEPDRWSCVRLNALRYWMQFDTDDGR